MTHTVGPVWRGEQNSEAKLLKSCYKSSLKLAEENELKSIAFPNIGTGVYGFPKEEAAKSAIKTVLKRSSKLKSLKEITFCVFDDTNYKIYQELLKENL